MIKKGKYTKDEELFLINNYNKMTYGEIANTLNRSENSIKAKAERMNLSKRKKINKRYFKEIDTPSKAYWLGFIFADEIIKTGRKQFDINYHVVKRNLEIAKYLGCKSLETEFIIPDFSKKYTKEIVRRIDNLDKNKKTIVLAPATTWTNKHWTIEGWQNLINEFKEEYNIILTASEKEKPLIKEIIQNTEHKNIIDLSGQTGLSDLVYIYKNADIVISPDSGSAHIAWAVNKPEIITLFFATSAKRTAPYGEKYYSISANISCSPCMKKRCKLNSNPNKCTRSITSEQIINIVKKVLQ